MLGEEIDILGPNGEIEYKGNGEFEIEGKTYHFTKVSPRSIQEDSGSKKPFRFFLGQSRDGR